MLFTELKIPNIFRDIFIGETWLNEVELNSNMQQYNVIRNDRKTRAEGVGAIYSTKHRKFFVILLTGFPQTQEIRKTQDNS